MIGGDLFTAILALFWVGEFVFASVVVYWFVSQGFSDGDATHDEPVPLESWTVTRNSLLLWGGFFVALLLLIAVAA